MGWPSATLSEACARAGTSEKLTRSIEEGGRLSSELQAKTQELAEAAKDAAAQHDQAASLKTKMQAAKQARPQPMGLSRIHDARLEHELACCDLHLRCPAHDPGPVSPAQLRGTCCPRTLLEGRLLPANAGGLRPACGGLQTPLGAPDPFWGGDTPGDLTLLNQANRLVRPLECREVGCACTLSGAHLRLHSA